MSGFFTMQQYQRPSNRMMSVPGCGGCGLHKTCHTPKMKPTGDGELGILFLAEAPDEKEDLRGKQLIGKSGQRLRRVLKKLDIDLDADCRKINGINCRPESNRTPTAAEIDACRPNLIKEIQRFKPKLIVPLGGVAVQSLLGHRWKKELGGITRWRGWAIPDRELQCWICPTFHPAYVEREVKKNPAAQLVFEKDLRIAMSCLDREFPQYEDEAKQVEILTEYADIADFLNDLLASPPAMSAFDYECTGLKPHADGHAIVTCAISDRPDRAVAFNMVNRAKPLMRKYLADPNIKKIAANMKFEEIWSRVRLKTRVEGWLWDTMLASHVLDNRPFISSLKFQCYVQYGLIDYDSHIEPFLKSADSDNANSFNNIYKIDRTELLVYNGVDAILEHRLARDQMLKMGILDPEYFAQTGIRPKVS